MNEESQKQLTRRGHAVYFTNPSIADTLPVRVTAPKTNAHTDTYMMYSPETGELVGKGAFAFAKEHEVDSEEFVKVYLKGIKQHSQLSKAGALLFELVYHELSGRKGKDKDLISLNYMLATLWKPDIARATFFRGMKELLDKEFLFRSVSADQYFVNIRFMFNGDRMVLVNAYKRKSTRELK